MVGLFQGSMGGEARRIWTKVFTQQELSERRGKGSFISWSFRRGWVGSFGKLGRWSLEEWRNVCWRLKAGLRVSV
jgi:hypothetical protein